MKTLRIISGVLLLIIAVNALAAGCSFITDPSGSGLHISPDRLKYSPFSDYLIPGIVLFVVNGVLNLVAALFILFNWKPYVSMLFFQALMLAGWIVIQMIMLQDFNMLHAIFLFLGLLLGSFAVILGKQNYRSNSLSK